MLAPAVVRAGVPRSPRNSGSSRGGHRRAATSAGATAGALAHHLRPTLLPPLERSSVSTSSTDPTRHLDLPNTPSSHSHPTDIHFFHRNSNFSIRPSLLVSQPLPESPSPPLVSLDGTKPPLQELPPSFPLPRQQEGGRDKGLWMSGLRLQFTQPQVEADFHVFLERNRSRTLPLLYTALMWTLGLIEVVLDSITIAQGEDTSDATTRLTLMLAALVCVAVQTVFRQVMDKKRMAKVRKEYWASVSILATMTLCSLSWTLATHTGLDRSSKATLFIVFLQLYIIGRRPLLFLEAAVVSTCSTCIFTALLVAYPAPIDTAASLTTHCIVLYVHLFWIVHMHQQLEYQQRVQYAEAVNVATLKREKETLDHDTKALKGEFFQLTLERFDIADVEEEGKVLTSAMEQAMGKLQMLGKKQDLPADVLKEIMKVITLLGSGSDLFKAQMEGSDWKNGLYGGDDELTRYIYETLNGEAGASRGTPRAAIQSPSLPPGRVSTDAVAMLPINEEAGSRSHTESISGLSDIDAGRAGYPSAGFLPASTTSQYDRSLSTLLRELDDWNLDIFEVATLTQGKPLFFIGMALFKKYNHIDTFHLDKVKLSNFLRELEGGYHRTNPYHNSAHAADVARSVHWFVRCGKMRRYCQDLEVFALIIASLAHDFQHPGKNNAYHVAIHDDKALLYNDRSVLENYHASQMFQLLLNPALNCNFLQPLSVKEFVQVRKLVVGLVLATDLAHSNEFLGRFKNWWAAMEAKEVMGGEGSLGSPSKARAADAKLGPTLQSSLMKELESEARLMLMKMALKCADVGHSAKRLALHEKWTARITEEFYRQGDEERRQGLPISPFMDRRKANLSASQLGFMDWIVLPLYTAWFRFLDPEERRQRDMWAEGVRLEVGGEGRVGGDGDEDRVTVMEQLRNNREYWRTWQGQVGGDGGVKDEGKDEVVSRHSSSGRQWTLPPLTEALGVSSRAAVHETAPVPLLTISVIALSATENPQMAEELGDVS